METLCAARLLAGERAKEELAKAGIEIEVAREELVKAHVEIEVRQEELVKAHVAIEVLPLRHDSIQAMACDNGMW